MPVAKVTNIAVAVMTYLPVAIVTHLAAAILTHGHSDPFSNGGTDPTPLEILTHVPVVLQPGDDGGVGVGVPLDVELHRLQGLLQVHLRPSLVGVRVNQVLQLHTVSVRSCSCTQCQSLPTVPDCNWDSPWEPLTPDACRFSSVKLNIPGVTSYHKAHDMLHVICTLSVCA